MAQMDEVLCDKLAVLQIIGTLTKKPLLLFDRSYKFTVEDFPEQFHKTVFGAIEHLADGGAEHIDSIDIDQFLTKYPTQYKTFCDNRGIEYINRAQSMADESKFRYYYATLKKYSLINKMRALGFDTSEFINDSLTDPRDITAMNKKFDNLSVDDILSQASGKITMLKQEYGKAEGMVEVKAGSMLKELVEQFKKTPEMGMPFVSPKLTTILRGRRLGKFVLESAASGIGKTRRMISEACKVGVPWLYNIEKKQWEQTGFQEKVLYISTELSPRECDTIFGAYLAGVDEQTIFDGKMTEDEENRVLAADAFLSQSNVYMAQLTDFNIDDIENLIRKYHYLYGVNYFFYDYLATSPKILAGVASSSKISGLREDNVLFMFAQKLKDLSTILDVHIQSATQLNGDWKSAKEADQNLLRGAKSIADKIDNGMILMPVREWDRDIIDQYMERITFGPRPNAVLHIYKVRQGKFNNVRLYVYFDRGTCRMTDCFCTDYEGHMLDIHDTNVKEILAQTESETMHGIDREVEAMEASDDFVF